MEVFFYRAEEFFPPFPIVPHFLIRLNPLLPRKKKNALKQSRMFISVQIGNDQGGGQHSTTKKTVLNPTPSLEEGGGWGIRQCIHSLTHTQTT